MTEAVFNKWYGDSGLNAYIVQQAKRNSNCGEMYEDCCQEAWSYVWLARDDCDLLALERIVKNAIKNYYTADKKECYISIGDIRE